MIHRDYGEPDWADHHHRHHHVIPMSPIIATTTTGPSTTDIDRRILSPRCLWPTIEESPTLETFLGHHHPPIDRERHVRFINCTVNAVTMTTQKHRFSVGYPLYFRKTVQKSLSFRRIDKGGMDEVGQFQSRHGSKDSTRQGEFDLRQMGHVQELDQGFKSTPFGTTIFQSTTFR